jgi:hypothetical protein
MDATPQTSTDEVAALRAALAVSEQGRLRSDAELAVANAMASNDKALIAHQALRIAKLERQVYGASKERRSTLVDQMKLELEELDANATEDEIAAEIALGKTTQVAGFTRKRPEARTTFSEHLPRERVVIDMPTACERCRAGFACASLARTSPRPLRSFPHLEGHRDYALPLPENRPITISSSASLHRRAAIYGRPGAGLRQPQPTAGTSPILTYPSTFPPFLCFSTMLYVNAGGGII